MSCEAIVVGDGAPRRVDRDEAVAYSGPGFVWLHLEGADEDDLTAIRRNGDIPEIAASALVATETRPRCDRIEDGALVNLRGPAAGDDAGSDRLVSIRLWVRQGRVESVTRRELAATAQVRKEMKAGTITDPGDLVAAFARAISTALDPTVADLGDRLDDVETNLVPKAIYGARSQIAAIRSEAIAYRRFVAPDRDALQMMAGMDFAWVAEEDRLHIREAADRFARMAEELEAVRERAALLHEQLTDMRSEQIDNRSLYIAVVAFIFLPLTFVTGLLGMNVEGIPFAHSPWSFWGVVILCIVLGAGVLGLFTYRHWLQR